MWHKDGIYKGKWRSGTFIDYATALENADARHRDWIFNRLESEANISLEEYLELCEIFRTKE